MLYPSCLRAFAHSLPFAWEPLPLTLPQYQGKCYFFRQGPHSHRPLPISSMVLFYRVYSYLFGFVYYLNISISWARPEIP